MVVLARIKGLLLTAEKVDRALRLFTAGVHESFPGSIGASVSLFDEQGRGSSAGATDPLVLVADEAQYQLEQGPCSTARETKRAVLIHDVGTDSRWPLWTRAMASQPIRSVISVPLMAGTCCLGTITIYSAQPGTYDATSALALDKLAAPAALLLDNIQTSETPRRLSKAFTAALTSRDSINRAQGILMERDGLSPDSSFRKLLRLARTSTQPMAVICAEIVAGRRRGSHDGD
ncbi:ANTAR domain-containing protein [Arthrobacter oryzae]|uniref:ANTAR domain-containing protein n=2 Tax=Arthrobacter oryzae TaxID=409290 RepID=A0A495ERW9_9MICC|nr:ANTAR domain-containing protein [Arthrobacter oryzae]